MQLKHGIKGVQSKHLELHVNFDIFELNTALHVVQ